MIVLAATFCSWNSDVRFLRRSISEASVREPTLSRLNEWRVNFNLSEPSLSFWSRKQVTLDPNPAKLKMVSFLKTFLKAPRAGLSFMMFSETSTASLSRGSW